MKFLKVHGWAGLVAGRAGAPVGAAVACTTCRSRWALDSTRFLAMQPGKVVILLSGRYAGKKAVIVKNYDDGTSSKPYGHALVCGLSKEPRKVRSDGSGGKLAQQGWCQSATWHAVTAVNSSSKMAALTCEQRRSTGSMPACAAVMCVVCLCAYVYFVCPAVVGSCR